MAPDPLATEVLVVGSGIAGCAAALSAARVGADVTLATKAAAPEDVTSWWAQGCIAVTREDAETVRADLMAASDGTADPSAVDVLVGDAADAVEDVLLDNMSPAVTERAVATLAAAEVEHRVLAEASGGITLETVPEYAATGVDVVSLGSLTHSAPALDYSFRTADGPSRRVRVGPL